MKNRRATPLPVPLPLARASALPIRPLLGHLEQSGSHSGVLMRAQRLPWAPSGAASASPWSFLQGNGRRFPFAGSAQSLTTSYLPAFSRLRSQGPLSQYLHHVRISAILQTSADLHTGLILVPDVLKHHRMVAQIPQVCVGSSAVGGGGLPPASFPSPMSIGHCYSQKYPS